MTKHKVNYDEHQNEFIRQLVDNPSLKVAEYCDQAGLNYVSARRYIKKPKKKKSTSTVDPAKAAIDKPIPRKPSGRRSSRDWGETLQDYLTMAIANPSLTMKAYAEEKDITYATLRRQFNGLRTQEQFRSLFDLYDRKVAQFSEIRNDRRSKSTGKTTETGRQRTAQASDRAAQKSAQGDQEAAQMVPNHTVSVVDSAQFGEQIRLSSAHANYIHGGYCRSAGVVEDVLDILTEIDPLSVSNELLIARGQYLRMSKTISGRLAEYETMLAEGTERYKPEGSEEEVDVKREIDKLLFGYAPRLRELEHSITNMTALENKRVFELRKHQQEQLMMPHRLPAAESALVIEMLEQREKNNWDAVTTANYIEKLGAKVPAVLLHEAKLELTNAEPEDNGREVTEEELDAITAEYEEEQKIVQEEWLPERHAELQRRFKAAEDRENGIEPDTSPSEIQEATIDESYSQFDEETAEGFDDLDSFEVLGGETC